MQPKMAAPPVYRPHALQPPTLQLRPAALSAYRPGVPAQPKAPPVYRPHASAQPKMAAPAVYRPANPAAPATRGSMLGAGNAFVQRKVGPASAASPMRFPAGSASRGVVQRLGDVSFEVKQGHVDFVEKIKVLVREDAPSGMTIHHKTSQSHLKKLTKFLEVVMGDRSTEAGKAAVALLETVEEYVKGFGVGGTSVFRWLNNMPLNLAYGPTARWHHMGDRFDGNANLTSQPEEAPDELHEKDKANRPKLFRSPSARSLQLGSMDALILALPVGIIAVREYMATEACVATIKKISAYLEKAIEEDRKEGNTPFYAPEHWQKKGDKYMRSMHIDVYKDWDPDAKAVRDEATVNREKLLKKWHDAYKVRPLKQGTKVNVQDRVFAFLGLFREGKFTHESIKNRYAEEFELFERIQRVVSTSARTIAAAGRTAVPITDANQAGLDDEVEQAYREMKYIVDEV